MTSYLYFSNASRDAVKGENPGASLGEVRRGLIMIGLIHGSLFLPLNIRLLLSNRFLPLSIRSPFLENYVFRTRTRARRSPSCSASAGRPSPPRIDRRGRTRLGRTRSGTSASCGRTRRGTSGRWPRTRRGRRWRWRTIERRRRSARHDRDSI